MRWVAVALASLGAAAAGNALADAPETSFYPHDLLVGAAFASNAGVEVAGSGFRLPGDDSGQIRYVPGQGLVRLSTLRMSSLGGAGSPFVDTIRVSAAGWDPRPGAALLGPVAGDAPGRQSFGLSLVRDWPAALSVDAGRLSLDVTPHAGLGVSSGGARTAEAGALLRLQQKMLKAVGMTGAGARTHLYLFAGASGRAFGLNLMRGQGAPRPDLDNGFVREAEAGLGFQRGFVQASLGVSQQRTTLRALGEDSRVDNRVGLTLSIR